MTRHRIPHGALACLAALLAGLAILSATTLPVGAAPAPAAPGEVSAVGPAAATRLRAPEVAQGTATSLPPSLPPIPSTSEPADLVSPTLPRIIPLPNSGQAPEHPGDRGGWLQISLFWFILGALAILALLVYRDGRRNKRKAAARARQRSAGATAGAPPAARSGRAV